MEASIALPTFNQPVILRLRLLVLAVAMIALQSAASGQQARGAGEDQPGDIYFFIRYDIGTSNSSIEQTLPPDYASTFQPPAGPMTTRTNNHPWYGEIGLGIGPKWELRKDHEIAVLLFYNFIGLSSMQKRFYTLRRPVAGVELEWGEPVRLQATTLQKTSPEVGLAYTWRKLTVHPSVQTYRLFVEDYVGESRDGCNCDSRLRTLTNLGSGLGARIDVQLRIDPQQFLGKGFDPWNTSAVGLFYERNGGRLWQVGVSLQVGMELITRHRRSK
jgi:hypothetical protein